MIEAITGRALSWCSRAVFSVLDIEPVGGGGGLLCGVIRNKSCRYVSEFLDYLRPYAHHYILKAFSRQRALILLREDQSLIGHVLLERE